MRDRGRFEEEMNRFEEMRDRNRFEEESNRSRVRSMLHV
jgi:hypothetical protein